jgi:thiol-disulfide isomerase/thioredoxin
MGKRLWLDNRKADRDAVLTRLGQRYGLFYFYAQSCGACEVFAPILRSVTDSHRMAVMAVSMDGGPSKDFPNYVVDSGQRARMGLAGNETPALVLFDTQTKRTIPVGYGVLSADEIMDRIFMLTNTRWGATTDGQARGKGRRPASQAGIDLAGPDRGVALRPDRRCARGRRLGDERLLQRRRRRRERHRADGVPGAVGRLLFARERVDALPQKSVSPFNLQLPARGRAAAGSTCSAASPSSTPPRSWRC